MECPFCNEKMIEGKLIGDGRAKVRFESDNQKLGVLDKLVGVGMIDAEYSLAKFAIEANYCTRCKKMIFDTNISN